MIGRIISTITNADTLPGFEPTTTIRINMACIFLTWVVAIAGAGILTMGIWMNRESRSECGFTNKHFLSLGGRVCFLHAISPNLKSSSDAGGASARRRRALNFALSFPFGSFPILCPLCIFGGLFQSLCSDVNSTVD
ncbi:hypothetical protein Bca52824_006875 [Brassica carinata]|uniref:Uncharacterized protein n=1 Tax=Brassica carinata TaxID=52824 RepID=A0A8X8B7L6_BRACI|nr:hypothetical protein Bca52824_006875 [Brassica carinata]